MPYDHEDPEFLFGDGEQILGDEEIEQSDLACSCMFCQFPEELLVDDKDEEPTHEEDEDVFAG